MENSLNSLQQWYFEQCDGDWEHDFGIKVDTLDNPGWVVTIDLIGTACENKIFEKLDQQISENNWIQCNVENGKFIGAGGPFNLGEIITIFIKWKKASQKSSYALLLGKIVGFRPNLVFIIKTTLKIFTHVFKN